MTSLGFQKTLQLAKKANANDFAASALELYKRVLAQDPDNDSAKYYAAYNLLDIGRITDAEAFFRIIDKEGAPKPWLIENLAGRLCVARSRLAEAQVHFRKARKLDPDSTVSAVFLANALTRQEKFDEARAVLLEVLDVKNACLDEVYLNLGVVARATGKYQSARGYFLKALEVDPEYTAARGLLNDVEFWLEYSGSKRSTTNQLETILKLAKEASAMDYEASAFELYKRVLGIEPQRHSAKFHAALNLLDIGRISDAEAYFGAINGDAAPNPWLLEYAAGRLCMGRARHDKAELHFRNAWRLNPNSTTPPVFLADSQIKQEKFSAAKTVLTEALKIGDTLDAVYFYLGQAARATEEYPSARKYFLKTLEIDPDYPVAKKNLEDMEFWVKFVGNKGRS